MGGLNFDAKVTALSFDAMLRLPTLISNDFPKGQLQPYFTLGPGVYFAKSSGSGLNGSDTSAGVKVGAGATWMFTRNFGVLGDYRFSHFSAESSGTEVDVNTHRLQFGVTLRF